MVVYNTFNGIETDAALFEILSNLLFVYQSTENKSKHKKPNNRVIFLDINDHIFSIIKDHIWLYLFNYI